MNVAKNILKINDLSIVFNLREGKLRAVDGISFNIPKKKTVGIVGESGSGKSVLAQSLLRILPTTAEINKGEILFKKEKKSSDFIDISKRDPNGRTMAKIRGNDISYIFQEPMCAFSTSHTIGNQMIECLRIHTDMSKKDARERSIEMLKKVGISNPSKRVDQYSFELSGGMRQRAMIALALSTNPSLIIADEPTTSLDCTIQAQILKLLQDMQEELGMSIMFITHNLGVVAQIADNIQVMYLGKVMETGTAEEIFYKPRHPYTVNLLRSIPKIGSKERPRLSSIPGQTPGPFDRPVGCCKFYNRCKNFIPGICDKKEPEIIAFSDTHKVLCWKYSK